MQDQFQAQLSSEEVLDLEIIDKKITWLNNKTLREKIMSITRKIRSKTGCLWQWKDAGMYKGMKSTTQQYTKGSVRKYKAPPILSYKNSR